jgi:predicted MFS family arabinose efflux permease
MFFAFGLLEGGETPVGPSSKKGRLPGLKHLHGGNPASALETAPRHALWLRTFSSLKYPNFRLLWFGTLFSSLGNWVQQVSLGWLAYDLTGSALLVGSLSGIRALPFLLVGPLGGVLADRMDRRKMMLACELCLALLALGLAVLVATDYVRVWHLFAFSLLSGSAWAINNPMRQSLTANSVPRGALMNAIALNSAAFNANRALGPAVGGVLIALTGPAVNFFIQAFCYFGVFLMVLPLRVPQADVSVTRRASLLSNFREGLRYAIKEQTILALILIGLIPSLFVMPLIGGLMPVFAKEVLHTGPKGLGLLLSFNGLGALIGTLALASLGNIPYKGRLLLAAGIGAGMAMAVFSFMTALPLALLVLVGMGACHQLFMSTNNTFIQAITTDAFRGRVMSLYMLDHGFMFMGGLLAGAVAELYGSPRAVLMGGGASVLLVLLMGLRFRSFRQAV